MTAATIPEVFAKLFEEVAEDKIVWRLADGTCFTAGQMVTECRDGTEMGRIYMSDALRVVRDLIARQASRVT